MFLSLVLSMFIMYPFNILIRFTVFTNKSESSVAKPISDLSPRLYSCPIRSRFLLTSDIFSLTSCKLIFCSTYSSTVKTLVPSILTDLDAQALQYSSRSLIIFNKIFCDFFNEFLELFMHKFRVSLQSILKSPELIDFGVFSIFFRFFKHQIKKKSYRLTFPSRFRYNPRMTKVDYKKPKIYEVCLTSLTK